jgi:hypothetical protein
MVKKLSRHSRWALWGGALLMVAALAERSWLSGLIGAGLLLGAGWPLLAARRATPEVGPWPWPPDFRSAAERLARPIDPTPKRQLPPDEKSAMIAQVAVTKDALTGLIAGKPPAWPWAVFTSVLVQRRNAVQGRLRRCASGYQPQPGMAPLTGRAYAEIARQSTTGIADLVAQLEQFMLSPAFQGAFGDVADEGSADSGAIVEVANRLMDYHDTFLGYSERCLQTPVERDVLVFVQDMGAVTFCPLLGYDNFIATMCARIGEAQDLLPYTTADTVVALDDASLRMTLPDGLMEHIVAHINRFSES